ncbi:hypothetical protein BKA56DRAFT_597044 [Ilyonectria sp. MPI-CAGE-AT-0026]|nr:hypothetical protein BKA56DRAFT_597044 [Ilyonectria sp. MPI-CAGE-AT-0026]
MSMKSLWRIIRSSPSTHSPSSMLPTSTLIQAPIDFRSATPTNANLTRSRPESYLIPSIWAVFAERLHCFGLKAQTLEKPWEGTVEALTVTSAVFAPGYYKGFAPVPLTTETATRHLDLPAGSFLVSAHQGNVGLTFLAREPENVDSWANSNIVPVRSGYEHPVLYGLGQCVRANCHRIRG